MELHAQHVWPSFPAVCTARQPLFACPAKADITKQEPSATPVAASLDVWIAQESALVIYAVIPTISARLIVFATSATQPSLAASLAHLLLFVRPAWGIMPSAAVCALLLKALALHPINS
jgi:hypothetical protein